ncbi:DUF5681 domain-containing protein [Tropicimonas sp. IMCC6043]|uniref:DUF5681 domain-containing protein n=1 Tax=Tropicimonas sp. IMCC6043 TaxID=2510645 RepID=UPI0013EA9B82|nr:DUF5681 domain-containing protein [Tropicimonas sp. IMCC6043]
MSKKYEKKGDYDVGYGKTPKHTQWQKGQSGNPSGKKKGKSLAGGVRRTWLEMGQGAE